MSDVLGFKACLKDGQIFSSPNLLLKVHPTAKTFCPQPLHVLQCQVWDTLTQTDKQTKEKDTIILNLYKVKNGLIKSKILQE